MKKSIYLFLLLLWCACNDPKAARNDEAEVPVTGASPVATAVTTAAASDDNKDLDMDYKMLRGNWQSTEDARYVMSFGDNMVYTIYKGEADTMKASYSLSHTSCKGADDNTEHIYLLEKDADGDMCYQLFTLTKDELSLINAERDNTLSFKRVK